MPDRFAEQVRRLICNNVREGHSRLLDADFCNIQPSPEKYPFQFWWDTCFQVVMLCRLGEFDLAGVTCAACLSCSARTALSAI